MLLVDAANVVGSRPTGWWRDRAGAARSLHRDLRAAIESGGLQPPIVLVLEGAACQGVLADDRENLCVVHAVGSGDDAIVTLAGQLAKDGVTLTVVTADRGLRDRVQRLGADVVGPRWLLDQLGQAGDSGGRSSSHDGG